MDVVLIPVVRASDVWPGCCECGNKRSCSIKSRTLDYLRHYRLPNHDYYLFSDIFNPDTLSNQPTQLFFFVHSNQQTER